MDDCVGREGVASSDSFVGLHRYAGDLAQHLAGGKKMFPSDTGLIGIAVMTNPHGHDDLFERSVAGALADAVDGALDLTCSGSDSRHGIGHRHAKVVVAVSGNGHVINSLHAAANGRDQLTELGGHGVAD